MTRPMVRTGILAVAAALALTACTSSSEEGPEDATEQATSVTTDATGATSAVGDGIGPTDSKTGCGPIDHPTMQVATHLVGDTEPPTPYTSIPPTSGWHTASIPEPGLATEPMPDPEIVAALENGIVVLAAQPDLLDDTVVTDLVAQFPDRLLVIPYEQDMPTPVALLTWGAMQRCPDIDRTAVTNFVLNYRVSSGVH